MTRDEVREVAQGVLAALPEDAPVIVVAPVLCALLDVGTLDPVGAPAPFAALARFLVNGATDGVADELLTDLDGFTPAAHAPALAIALHARGVAPYFCRLPRLLLPAYAELAWRCADDARHAAAPLLFETWLAAHDTGLELPPRLVARVEAAMTRTDLDSRIAAYVARLRRAARDDVTTAFALADEAIAEVGAAAVEDGLVAVAARAAVSAPARFDGWCARQPLDALALLAEGAAFAGVRRLDAGLGRLGGEPPRHVRDWYEVAFDLVAGAAAIGDVDAADHVMARAGLPAWALRVATGKALRRFALRGGDPRHFVERVRARIEEGVEGPAARGAPRAPAWSGYDPRTQDALWRLDAEPLAQAPWWTPWGAALP